MSCFSWCGSDSRPMQPHNRPMQPHNPAGHYQRDDQSVVQTQSIAVPAIPVDELRDITDNFGSKALIGEGSYGRVNVTYKIFGVLTRKRCIQFWRCSAGAPYRPTKLSKDKVKECVDTRLLGEYHHKAVTKLAVVAALCVKDEAKLRPDMSNVVKALQTVQDFTFLSGF
ncbi:hypothetical protein IGI04_016581 [Brassica rapa subsp. trilocularis]|uniref:Protein kinase domain-containing protein n=1 Tax=Brassica rapa subsp. trilocularis TaxID=1813537 RepID=A0ABQ7MTD8_BRACM|nr:hypothetical protein IGI04_016581 [Brassica rapa subsp. trilocularis]